jgi:diguanylate cyclase (GGDEF)-like protein
MQHLKLKTKLLIILLPLVMVTCLASSWMFYEQLRSSLEENLVYSTDNAASQGALQSFNHIGVLSTDINFMAANMPIDDLMQTQAMHTRKSNQSTILSAWQDIITAKPGFEELYLLSNNERVIFAHHKNPFYLVGEDINWLIHAVKMSSSEEAMFSGIMDTASGKRMVFTKKIVANSEFVGTAVFTHNITPIQAVAADLALKGDYRVIFRNNEAETLYPISALDQELIKFYERDKNQAFYSTKGHKWKALQKDAVSGDVLVFANADQYFENVNDLNQRAILSALVLCLIVGAVGWLFIKNAIIHPVNQLKRAALQIANGESDIALSADRKDEMGELFGSMKNMAERIEKEKKRTHQLAYFDTLTSLNNKQHFLEALPRLIEHDDSVVNVHATASLAVMIIDLDNFKQINEIHGYHMGNSVLKESADTIKQAIDSFRARYSIPATDAILCRTTGDEFALAIKLNNKDKDNLPLALAEMIRDRLTQTFTVERREFRMDCHIGWERGGNTPFEIYEKADMAMHDGKQRKVRIHRFEPELIERRRRNQTLADNITRALDLDEFSLNYQPKHNVKKDAVNEFEALIRWNQPEEGFISPGVFIPFAEEANMIADIDAWVMHKVISDIQSLEVKGWKDFIISFNVSGERVADPAFSTDLMRTIRNKGINPAHLQVEITEHSLIQDVQGSINCINELRSLGLSVALDDFGTGHSSLGYLKDLPINSLKIDRCFVQDVDLDEAKFKMLKHITGLAHDLGLEIVAEGIERVEEADVLKSMGYDLLQGFYFHKPMPLEAIESLFDLKAH